MTAEISTDTVYGPQQSKVNALVHPNLTAGKKAHLQCKKGGVPCTQKRQYTTGVQENQNVLGVHRTSITWCAITCKEQKCSISAAVYAYLCSTGIMETGGARVSPGNIPAFTHTSSHWFYLYAL